MYKWYARQPKKGRTARKISYTGTEYDILLEPNECRINFDANSGSGDMVALNVKYETSEKLPLCSYTRRGYTFKEWNTEKNGSGISFSDGQDVTKAVPATTSIKLYAQWKEIKVSDVLAEPKKMVREEKTTEKLSVKVIPSNALNKRLSYVSSSPETAGVDATGKVQFKKPGNAVITAKSVNGKEEISSILKVTENALI